MRLACFGSGFAEECGLLRAGHQRVTLPGQGGKLLLAELGAQRQRPRQLERAGERLGVERHRAVAGAKMQRLVVKCHVDPHACGCAAALPPRAGAHFAPWGGPAALIECRSARVAT